MRFKWLAWTLISIQLVLYGWGVYTRITDLLLLEFASAASWYGYLVGSIVFTLSYACVLLLAMAYVIEKGDEE